MTENPTATYCLLVISMSHIYMQCIQGAYWIGRIDTCVNQVINLDTGFVFKDGLAIHSI